MVIVVATILAVFGFWLLLQRAMTFQKGLRAEQARSAALEGALREAHRTTRELELHNARLQEERRAAVEAEVRLGQAFSALSAEALSRNNQAFLDLARTNFELLRDQAGHDLQKRQEAIDHLIKPVKESLAKFDTKLTDLELARVDSMSALKQQITTLAGLQTDLNRETSRLAGALRATAVRGRWGEIQLRRVVELAGMVSHCDFYEQLTVETEGNKKRPDMVVKLPAGRVIVVDSKVPLDAYLEASEADDEQRRRELLKRHADQIRLHIRALASKGYAEHFSPSPEFVVLFLPGEIFFSAALSQDPTLIEVGAEQGVILATPTTLISLLRSVSYGWKQEALSQNAQKISELGAELHKRLSLFASHWGKVGKQLGSAVQAYNDAAGSLEHRVLVTAREFERLGASKANVQIESPSLIDRFPRDPQPE